MSKSSAPLVLGIESSCDETGVGIVLGRKLLANKIASSVAEHARFGGVVPEVAARAHVDAILPAIERALATAKVKLSDLDAIAVTAGPGLAGALLVGASAANGLAAGLGIPLYGVNHLAAHVAVEYLDTEQEIPATIALLVSGGHTSILKVDEVTKDINVMGATMDDAAGEAFDKIARLLGLPFPGGPELDRLATTGNSTAINFPRAMTLFTDETDRSTKEFSFSFSGLKSAVARHIELAVKNSGPLSQSARADIASSFQEAVVDVLLSKAVLAAKREGIEHLLIAGGVAANSRLRALATERTKEAGLKLAIPSPALCTDNGAMVAAIGSLAIAAGRPPSAAGLAVDPGAPVEQVLVP